MKLSVVSSSEDGWIDQSISDGILKLLPIVGAHEADAVIVPVSYREKFCFNQRLLEIKGRIIVIDYTEFGWEAGTKQNVLGSGAIRTFGHLDSEQWGMLDQWAAGAPIIAHFKRELLRRDASDVLMPVEYLCRLPIPPRQSREEFTRRPMEVFSSWGLSNPVRQVLHGDIFKNAHTSGIHVVDAWDQDQHFDGRTWDSKWPVDGKVWATIHCPHYNRKPMNEVMRWQHRAKLSVSLPGSGVKCFRSAEAPIGSIMALQEDDVAWTYDWVDGENCIRLARGKEFESLLDATRRDLYDIYCRAQETIARYQPRNYVADYILPAIEARLGGRAAPMRKSSPAMIASEHPGHNQFLHRGDLGDIIACLPSIRALGGGELLIAPHTGKPMEGRQDLRGARFDAIKPLLAIQPYIHGVRWVDEPPESAIDFSTFRKNTIPGQSLSLHQARHVGAAISEDVWLHNVTPHPGLSDRIIVARTARYHNWRFPWPQIVQEHRERILFIGLPGEHKAFCKLVGSVEYLPTKSLLEVAEVIAGSQLLISNQTVAGWIGLGLGHPLIQEQWTTSPDSMIPRLNAQYWQYGEMPKIPRPMSKAIASAPKKGRTISTVTIVFPLFSGDKPQAQALAELIRDMGGVESHHCLLVCPEGTDIAGVIEPLREAFGAVDTHTYAATLYGWPYGPNEVFAEAALLIARDARFHDFLWIEPDCIPTGPTWADQIAAAYRACGLPMLGVSTDTVAMDSRQVVGRHVIGVAVYPKNFAQLCPLVKSMTATSAAYRKANAMPKAFDAYFGAYTVPRNAETRLIQHFWRSSEFRQESGVIVAGKTVAPGVENTVNPEAILLHGCKDFSLLNIIRERQELAPNGGDNSCTPLTKTSQPTPATALLAKQTQIAPPTGASNAAAENAALPAAAVPRRLPRGVLSPVPPEQWIVGADGLPIPPFMKGQPEFDRMKQLKIVSLQTDGFKTLRKYARVNLKINTFQMTADKIIDVCVLAERTRGKEEWTKVSRVVIPPRVETPAPVHETRPTDVTPQVSPMPQWGQGAPVDNGISPEMREKMIRMRQERGLPVPA